MRQGAAAIGALASGALALPRGPRQLRRGAVGPKQRARQGRLTKPTGKGLPRHALLRLFAGKSDDGLAHLPFAVAVRGVAATSEHQTGNGTSHARLDAVELGQAAVFVIAA